MTYSPTIAWGDDISGLQKQDVGPQCNIGAMQSFNKTLTGLQPIVDVL